ncbi:sigma-54-dependent Fis family transcriptional regulator [candidate division KSB1 bacterium]|nr:sigma-54-dependent Fis family transcriptional regulator [candidate division KSB1 bacterium]
MNEKRILIVDDEEDFTNLAAELLTDQGCAIERAYSGIDALQLSQIHNFDLVLLDLIMPVMHGLETLKKLKNRQPGMPVIILTGNEHVETAIEAMKSGAYDYITKPVDWDRLKVIINNALLTGSLTAEVHRLKGELKDKFGFGQVIGISRRMQEVFQSIEKVLDSPVTVAIHGESGTGKELLANAIHNHGERRKKPFVPVNCAAIPEPLLESELFGHEKGAFTGAYTMRPGKFEQANGGTIFLDEIGDMPQTTQVKILRILQEQCFQRVGGTELIKVDVRIISATNKNLEEEMKQGRFREDLYYRISVYPILIPPLRERKEDIPVLVAFFIRKFHEMTGHDVIGFSSKAMDYLINYKWPGNIRELQNVVERSILTAGTGLIQPEHLPMTITSYNAFNTQPNGSALDFRTAISLSRRIIPLDEIEKEALQQALKLTNYNMSSTATALGIGRTTLYRKIHKYDIEVPRFAITAMGN